MKNCWLQLICPMLLLATALRAEPALISLGPEGGDVRSLTAHPARPNQVFLGTADGQIYRSDDRGSNWRKIDPGLGRRDLVLDSLVFDPSDPTVLYAGGWELKSAEGALFRSEDGGKSWAPVDLGRDSSTIRAVAIAPSDSNRLAVGISEGVLLSRDRGRTWRRINRGYRSLHNVHSLAFDPFDAETLYVGTWRLAWRTRDLGKKWEPIHNGMFWDSDLFTLLVDPRDPSTLYASACSGIYKSGDYGSQWSKLRNGLPEEAKRTRTLRFDPSDPNTLYAGTTEGLFKSDNGGRSWQRLLADVVINAVLVNPQDSSLVLVGTDDAGVLQSFDGGKTFHSSNKGFVQRQVAAVAMSPTRRVAYAAVARDGHYGGFFWSEDSGQTWEAHNQGLKDAVSGIRTILPADDGEVLLGTHAGLYSSFPDQGPWSLAEKTRSLAINDLAWLPGSREKVLLATYEGLFSLVRKTGALHRHHIAVYDREITAVLSDPHRGIIMLGTDMGVFRSDDQGKTWVIKVRGLPYVSVLHLAQVENRIFCGTRKGLFFTDDLGETWNGVTGVYPIEIGAIAASAQNRDKVYASDLLVGYLFSSQDGGLNWEAIDIGPLASRISSLTAAPDGNLLAGTLSEGVLKIVASEQPVAERQARPSGH